MKKVFIALLFIATLLYFFTLMNINKDYYNLKNAIDNDDIKKFEELLYNGANPESSNAKSFSGIIEHIGEGKHNIFTILQYAAYCGSDEAVKILLNYGADPNYCPPSTMYSALTRAVMNEQTNIKLSTIEILVNNGADVNYSCNGNRHVLYWLINNYSSKNSFSYDDGEIFKYLVEHGADVYSENYLLLACQFGKSDIIKYLIDECEYKLSGSRELFEYCEATIRLPQATFNYEIVEYFIENGADIDEIVEDGMSVREYLRQNAR